MLSIKSSHITQLNRNDNVGFTQEEYEADIKLKVVEVKRYLSGAHDEAKTLLEQRLASLLQQISDIKSAYESHIVSLTKRIQRLEQLRGKVPFNILEKAKKALRQGDNEAAKKIFDQLDNQSDPIIEAVAESKYQLAKIATDQLRYKDALVLYTRAAQLMPENSLYLNEAGFMYKILGRYDKAIEYYEKALQSDLKTYGKNHPQVGLCWNNLGLVWGSKGEFDKAIEHLEKASVVFREMLIEDYTDT